MNKNQFRISVEFGLSIPFYHTEGDHFFVIEG